MSRPKLADLFCGGGGAGMGYFRAGFDVVGIDIAPQKNYPFEFIQADALTFPLEGLDAIHASPPCQGYSNLRKGEHPRLIAPTRERLMSSGLPYVIENIMDAAPHLRQPVKLCGSMFGLRVQRHRLFETSFPVGFGLPPCAHGINGRIRAYYGKKGWLVWTPAAANVQRRGRTPLLRGRTPLLRGSVSLAEGDMGIDWMTWDELREAIPPAYSRFIGEQLMRVVRPDAEHRCAYSSPARIPDTSVSPGRKTGSLQSTDDLRGNGSCGCSLPSASAVSVECSPVLGTDQGERGLRSA